MTDPNFRYPLRPGLIARLESIRDWAIAQAKIDSAASRYLLLHAEAMNRQIEIIKTAGVY